MKGNFKIIFLIIFMIAALLGILVFSGTIPLGGNSGSGNSGGGGGNVLLWGTLKKNAVDALLEDFRRANPSFNIKYVERPEDTFDRDLLEAFASGQGPDIIFISDDLVLTHKNKIFVIPYQSLPADTFKSTFASAGDVFLTSKGVLALPIAVDPMVMYYNRRMLDTGGIASPPQYWDEFSEMVPVLTKKDEKGLITQSTVAMGQFFNVSHAKEILSTLFMQTGNPIVSEGKSSFIATLSQNSAGRDSGSVSVLKFYADFTNPLKDVYSWNRSFPSSLDAFSAENLAFYFGFASELPVLMNKNPNQNFQVAPMPQIRDSSFKLTFSKVTGVAISSSSKNFGAAFTVASLLTGKDFSSKLVDSLGLTPARRDLFKNAPAKPYLPTFYASALFARSWLDPSRDSTNQIFQGIIEKVLSNSMTAEQAIIDGNNKLGALLSRYSF